MINAIFLLIMLGEPTTIPEQPIAEVYAIEDTATFNGTHTISSIAKYIDAGEYLPVYEYIETDHGPYWRLANGYIPAWKTTFDPTTIVIEEEDTSTAIGAITKGVVTITEQGGIYYYDGRKETYYSSRVLYHYRTPEWWTDEEGFYHDVNGYYVVAASDMEQGTTFDCSKGTCIVLDSGCAPGVTDYYTNF